MKPLPLDALTLPLRGSRLIEASAGTGKTWTIAALYLRLVLGHGADDGDGNDTHPPRALAPGEILVMTFTRAATRELSDRIRARLAEAARCFRGEAEPAAQDHFLRALIDAYPESPASLGLSAQGDAAVPGAPRSRLAAAHRLALAAEAMDDAAVHTIDAWCQRMLLEHAFDSGQLFDEELVADELQLQREAVLDYWRREVYPLDGAPLDALLRLWPDAEALGQRLARLPERGEGLGDFEGAGLSLGGWLQRQVEALRALKLGWAERAERLRAWLHAQQATKTFNGNKLRATSIDAWCAAIALWASEPGAEAPELDEKQWWRLSAEGLVDALAKGQPLPALPPEIDELAALGEALATRMTLGEALMRHAAAGVGQQLATLKRRQGRFGFADLQARLARALAGPSGARLRERIVAQYPAVLIDEFQDTSPLQYRLFDRLYDVAADARQTLLLLIGDPKQSIYGFRGADIYSYLAARQATAGRLHMLGTNHRSTQALVGAVNRVFAQAEAGWTAARAVVGEPTADFGAFALPQVGRHALPFEPVAARGRREVLVASIGGGTPVPLPALNLQWLPKALKAEPLRRAQAEHAAGQMLALLEDPTVGFREGDEASDDADEVDGAHFRRLRPGDVAV
ncbi:MAG TPA: UvrD-helicase domain-containing protein, partial [Burkholderiaceae bacterium]|nr:UvrD-helicase domain-containing protein [Burkholderiaceae bacterium]